MADVERRAKTIGGILADDMGLGKTLTMISLVLKVKEIEDKDGNDENDKSSKYPGGTLVICPASLINQWGGEVERRTRRGLLNIEVYHGPRRETKPKRLVNRQILQYLFNNTFMFLNLPWNYKILNR